MNPTRPLRALDHRGKLDTCMTPLVQNPIERARGTWWCPRCEQYADGSGGFALGEPLRIGLEDRQPRRRDYANAIASQTALDSIGLSEG